MSYTPFYLTVMGRRFYEGTLPDLVAELRRLNTNLERMQQIGTDPRGGTPESKVPSEPR